PTDEVGPVCWGRRQADGEPVRVQLLAVGAAIDADPVRPDVARARADTSNRQTIKDRQPLLHNDDRLAGDVHEAASRVLIDIDRGGDLDRPATAPRRRATHA